MKIVLAFAFLAIFGFSTATPLVVRENISDQIIDVPDNDTDTFVAEHNLDVVLRQTFNATRDTSGGLVRSRLGFLKLSRAGSGFTLPPIPGVEFSSTLTGSVTFNGYLARSVDNAVDRIAQEISSNFDSFYRKEKKNLRTRARGGFFSFFQAGASYGYTDDEETRRMIQSNDFSRFSNSTRETLRNSESQRLIARYDVTYNGMSNGRGGVLQAFAYIMVNQLTLDSGEILNIVKGNPELVVADQNGDVIDRVEPSEDVEIKPENINDSVIDITLS